MSQYGVHDAIFPWLFALFGLCIGSFLNVVIYRLPVLMEREWWADIARMLGDPSARHRAFGDKFNPVPLTEAAQALDSALAAQTHLSLARPRSRCPSCGHVLAWHENLPVLGWLRLRGKCSACKSPISFRYPVIELFTGALFAACALKFGPTPGALAACAAVSLLVAMAFIDLDTQLLPDSLTFPLIGLGLVGAGMGWTGVTLQASAWGVVWGFFALWIVATLYKLVRGVEGMGEGDFKLLAGLGALMGWQSLPSIILLSSLVGAIVGIGMIVFRKHGRDVPIPFGPYLVGGGIVALFFGQTLSRVLWQMN